MVGEVTTQGDRAIRAHIARRWFGLDGSGIKIGIISDSFNASGEANDNIQAGDLPGAGNPDGYTQPVRILQDLATGSDEGRALAQILFDVAPGAELLFHTTGDDEQDFAEAVRSLTDAGADIILDDILLSTSTFFQDGVAAQAVNQAVAQGVTFVTAAGNNSDRSYESPFRGSNTRFTVDGLDYEAHDFDSGAGVDLFQDIQLPADANIDLLLNWAQASGNLDADVDLFLMDSPQLPGAGGNVLADSSMFPSSGETPSKRIFYSPTADETVYLMIARRSDADNSSTENSDPGLLKWITFTNSVDRGTVYQYVNDTPDGGSSTIYGHQNAQGAITVGAVSVFQTPSFGIMTPTLEAFSSVGSVPILFDAEGNPLPSPADRQKPEIVGPDRITTSVTGFDSFVGTSAATPHVAATVALMLQRAGGRGRLTLAQILTAIEQHSLPVTNSQVGFLQADTAILQAAGAEIIGTSTDDVLQGQDIAENMTGLGGNDSLSGADGFDALFGETGEDYLSGDRGNDYLLGQGGADQLLGGLGRDWLNGGIGADSLNGGAGDDEIRGGRGRDSLAGGRGHNILIGGRGSDRFLLHAKGVADIQDFHQGSDRLVLPETLSFEQLTIQQGRGETLIKRLDRTLASLDGISTDRLSAADFISNS